MAGAGIDKRALGWLSVGHLFNDVNQGVVPALLPFFVAERGMSYTAAGGLVLAATMISSLVQPLLGHLSDERPMPFFIPLGIFFAGAGIAVAVVVSSYPATLAAVFVSGLGVAAFHPESTRYANYASGARRATGMSVFSVGGNVGTALGPAAVTALATAGGARAAVWLVLPTTLVSALIARELPRFAPLRPRVRAGSVVPPAPLRWGPFARLGCLVVVRSLLSFGLMSFVPLFLVTARGRSKGAADLALTAMLLSGAVATLAGGRLADRYGRRAVLLGSLLPIAPLILVFARIENPSAALACLMAIGAFSLATYSIAVVMGQEYLPGREGIAAGVTMGLAIGLGGAGVPLLGLVADRAGVAAVFPILAALALLAAAIGLTLPEERATLRPAVPSAA